MKMRTLRRIKKLQARTTSAPRIALRRRFDLTDVSTEEHDLAATPEAVFDRITGPYGRAYAQLAAMNRFDEET